MSKLKRTVLYSTAVVALGLGAVISIYSDTQQTNLVNIEPAKSEIVADAAVLDTMQYTSEINVATAEQSVDDVLAEIEEIMNAVSTLGTDAANSAADMIINIEPAAGPDQEHSEEAPHSGDHH